MEDRLTRRDRAKARKRPIAEENDDVVEATECSWFQFYNEISLVIPLFFYFLFFCVLLLCSGAFSAFVYTSHRKLQYIHCMDSFVSVSFAAYRMSGMRRQSRATHHQALEGNGGAWVRVSRVVVNVACNYPRPNTTPWQYNSITHIA